MNTLSGEATLPFLTFTSLTCTNEGSTLKGRNLSLWSTFLSLRVDPILERFCHQEIIGVGRGGGGGQGGGGQAPQ